MILKRIDKDTETKVLYESSNILASTLNKSTNDLTIIFKTGTKYKYANVSKTDYIRFESAESQGVIFNSHIKKYPFEKLEAVNVEMILKEILTLKTEEKTDLLNEALTNLRSIIKTLNDNTGTYSVSECETLSAAITKYTNAL